MSGPRWKIAVVGDGPEGVAAARRLLLLGVDRDCELTGATTGAGAIRLCLDPAVGPPDCLVLEDGLPDMGTLEVLEALRSGRGPIACPVVVLTGEGRRGLGPEALRRGAQDHLEKDRLTAGGLAGAIEKAIGRHAVALEIARGVGTPLGNEAGSRTQVDAIPRVAGPDGRARGSVLEEDLSSIVHPDDLDGRYRALAETLPQMIWSTKPDGSREYSSPQWCDYTGFSSPQELVDRWLEALHPDDQARVDGLWGEARATGEDYDTNFRVRRHDGVYRWFKTRGVAVRDPDGRIVRWIGTSTDIHDERSQADAIRASEQKLRLLFANAPVSVAMLDREMRIVVISRRWFRDLRLPDRDLTGRCLYDVFPEFQAFPEFAERCKEIHRRCLAGAVESSEEECFERADGSKDWLRWDVRPWHGLDGEIGGIIIFLDPINNRKQAEQARRESERMARSILDSLSASIAVLDEAGVVLAVNRSWAEFAGRDGGAIGVAEGANYLAACDSDRGPASEGAAEVASGIRDVLAGGRDSFTAEYSSHAPGEGRWFSSRVVPFVGEGPRRVVVTHVDVTEQKRAEEALRGYAGRLESLHAIDFAILSAHSPGEIAGVALHHLARLVPCWTGAAVLYHFDRDEVEVINSIGPSRAWHPPGTRLHHLLSGHVEIESIRRGQIVVKDDIHGAVLTSPVMEAFREIGLRSYVLVPLMDRGALVGSLMLGSMIPSDYTPAHVEVISDKANLLSIAIRQALLFEEVRSGKARLETLSRRLIRAEEEERRRIALELHDEVGQSLTAVKIHLQVIGEGLDDRGDVRARLDESIGLIGRTLRQARSLSLDLRPSLLDDLGLVVALRSLLNNQARVAGFEARYTPIDIPPGFHAALEIETACYRVAQEALTNVVRHAGAKAVEVELRLEGSLIRLLVRDDGEGFDPAEARSRAEGGASLGVLGMHERVELLGGRFAIRSASGRGTEVSAEFPLTATPRPESEASDGADSRPPGR